MEQTEQVDDSPLHEYAASKLIESHSYGDVIHDDYLLTLAGLDHYRADDQNEVIMTTVASIIQREKEFALKLLAFVSSLRDLMLQRHSMRLVRVRDGYRIMQPSEQTKSVMDEYVSRRKKLERKASLGLTCIATDRLTAEQRRENEDARAKLAQIRMVEARCKTDQMPQLPEHATG